MQATRLPAAPPPHRSNRRSALAALLALTLIGAGIVAGQAQTTVPFVQTEIELRGDHYWVGSSSQPENPNWSYNFILGRDYVAAPSSSLSRSRTVSAATAIVDAPLGILRVSASTVPEVVWNLNTIPKGSRWGLSYSRAHAELVDVITVTGDFSQPVVGTLRVRLNGYLNVDPSGGDDGKRGNASLNAYMVLNGGQEARWGVDRGPLSGRLEVSEVLTSSVRLDQMFAWPNFPNTETSRSGLLVVYLDAIGNHGGDAVLQTSPRIELELPPGYSMSSALGLLSAVNSPRYALTATSDPAAGGQVIVQTDPGADDKYPAGTTLSLLAQPAAGYVFAHWSGAASGTAASTQITLNADTNVVGHFRLRDPGKLQFSQAGWAFDEAGGPAQLSVARTGAGDGAVSAGFRLAAGGTATAGTDFTLAAGTLNWADGETGTKTFTIGVVDDAALEPSETVLLELVDPTGGAVLGTPATATVTIADNDADPSRVDTAFTVGADAAVHALAVQPNGWTVVGGRFTQLGGQPRTGLGRLVPNGSVDAGFAPAISGIPGAAPVVWALAVQTNGLVMVGGEFATLGGLPARNLGGVWPDGSLPTGLGLTDGPVWDLALYPGGLLVGGRFSVLNSLPVKSLGLLEPLGIALHDLRPGFALDESGAPGAVRAVAARPSLDGWEMLVGGQFSRLGDVPVSGLGLIAGSGFASSFNPQLVRHGGTPEVRVLVPLPDRKFLVAGWFDMVAGQPRSGLARLLATGEPDPGFNVNADGPVHTVALQADGGMVVDGDFTMLGGQPRSRLARVLADGTLDPGFKPGINGPVHAVAIQADGGILVGGAFTAVGGLPRTNLARLKPAATPTETLSFNAESVTWRRGGPGPELWRADMAYTLNGLDWIPFTKADADRISGGWKLDYFEDTTPVAVRARGYVSGGDTYVEAMHPPRSEQSYALKLAAYTEFGPDESLGRIVADPPPGPDGKYPLDTVVTLTAMPNPGFVFNYWGEAASGTSPVTQITVTGALEFRAYFRVGNPGLLALFNGEESFGEAQGPILVQINRQGASEGEVSIGYRLGEGTTAALGADFTVTPERLFWANGEAGFKSFTITLVDDSVVEPQETIVFELTEPTGGAVVGDGPSSVRFTVVDNDVAPRFAVNLQANPAVGGSVQSQPGPGQDGKYADGTVITLTATPAEGYAFVNWSGAASGTALTSQVTLTADTSVTANFRLLNPGTVAFTQAGWSVNEGDGSVTLSVTRTGDSEGAVSVGYRLVPGGTATEGADFTFTPGTLSWANREMGAKSFTIAIKADGVLEESESFEVELVQATGGAVVVAPAVATVTLTDRTYFAVSALADPPNWGEIQLNPPPGPDGKYLAGTAVTVTAKPADGFAFDHWSEALSGISPSHQVTITGALAIKAHFRLKAPGLLTVSDDLLVVREDSGRVAVGVNRRDGSDGMVSVSYRIPSGAEITLGQDLTITPETLVWADGESGQKVFWLEVQNDAIQEADESFRLELSNPTGGALLDVPAVTRVTVVDNDVAPRFAVNLQANPAVGGSVQAQPGPGQDGKYADGTVITLTAVPTEGYAFVNWSGAASGTALTTQVTLAADASVTANFRLLNPGTIAFTQTEWSAGEGSGSVTVSVTRTGGSDGAVSMGYRLAAGGTATEGTDFTLTPGTLSWSDGETGTKSFTVTLRDDGVVEAEESFRVELNGPTGGATLGTPNSATVRIRDEGLKLSVRRLAPEKMELSWAGSAKLERAYSLTGPWSEVAEAVSPREVTYGSEPVQFFRLNQGGIYSQNIAGMIGKEIPAGQSIMVANPLNLGRNTVAEVMMVPWTTDGVTLSHFTNPGFVTSYSIGGAWIEGGDIVVAPGGGFYVESTDRFNWVAMGEVALGKVISIPQGQSICSSVLPQAGSLDSLEYPVGDDKVSQFSAGSFAQSQSLGGTWLDLAPVVSIGESFFVVNDGAAKPWKRTLVPSPPKAIAFTQANWTVSEDAGTLTLSATRMGRGDGAVSASVRLAASSTAIAGQDFTFTPGTLTWADGEMGTKSFTITLLDDATGETTETIRLELVDPTGGATLASPAVASVDITDNEVAPRFALTLAANPTTAGVIQSSPAPGDDGKYAAGTVVTLTAAPAGGYTFANWSGAASGASATTQLTLVGDATVTANFVSANQPPVSSGFAAATPFNQPLLIPYVSLLEPVRDPEGREVHVVAVGSLPLIFPGLFAGTAQLSTNGALVIADGARATYIPNQDFVGADKFSYVVADAANVSVTVYAQIAVLPPGVEPNAARDLTASDADGVSFSFAGLPGRLYEVQRSSAALGPWQKVGELAISPDGNGFYTDPKPPTGSGFYRTVLLPQP